LPAGGGDGLVVVVGEYLFRRHIVVLPHQIVMPDDALLVLLGLARLREPSSVVRHRRILLFPQPSGTHSRIAAGRRLPRRDVDVEVGVPHSGRDV